MQHVIPGRPRDTDSHEGWKKDQNGDCYVPDLPGAPRADPRGREPIPVTGVGRWSACPRVHAEGGRWGRGRGGVLLAGLHRCPCPAQARAWGRIAPYPRLAVFRGEKATWKCPWGSGASATCPAGLRCPPLPRGPTAPSASKASVQHVSRIQAAWQVVRGNHFPAALGGRTRSVPSPRLLASRPLSPRPDARHTALRTAPAAAPLQGSHKHLLTVSPGFTPPGTPGCSLAQKQDPRR